MPVSIDLLRLKFLFFLFVFLSTRGRVNEKGHKIIDVELKPLMGEVS